MADEKKTVGENKGNGKFSKFIEFFRNLPQNIATPFKNMWHELKKVTWPTRQDLIKYTCIVILFMVFMGVVIGLLDMGSSRLVTAISSLNKTDSEVILAEDAAEEAAEAVTEAAEETAQDAAETVQEAAEDAAQAVEETLTEENAQNEGGQETSEGNN